MLMQHEQTQSEVGNLPAEKIDILKIRTIFGPNVYHSKPVIVATLDLKNWTDIASDEIPNFIDQLLTLIPGLNQHTCSPGYIGGFVERLNRGTYLAHITEHVTLELANLSGMHVSYGKSRFAGEPGHYFVVVRFVHEDAMKQCLRSAVEIVNAILLKKPINVADEINHIKQLAEIKKLGPSAQAICDAAEARGIPCHHTGFHSLLQLGYGKYQKRTQAAVTDRTSLIATELVQDKEATKNLLRAAGIPVPSGLIIREPEDLAEIFEKMDGPFALKPRDGHHGNGVVLNIKTLEEMKIAFQIASHYCSDVIVEEMCQGRDYRVLVIDQKLVAAAERRPPMVVGDGQRNILALIEELNADSRRGDGHVKELTKVEIDEVLIEHLRKQTFNLETIPQNGQEVILRPNANLSSGGDSKDVTDEMHPEIKFICERIAEIVGLDICGIDIIHKNISEPPGDSFKVIEVNAGPGLRMHLAPTEGKPRDVGGAIVDMLYPPGTPHRIPIAAVTGTNGKTTTVRLLGKIMSQKPKACVGITTTDGIWIGSHRIQMGDTTGPQSTRMILSDPKVDVAVLEVARGGLLRGGLGYDWSDVSVITNIRPDHIGQDGIETLDDVVWIKSLVAERVKENGCLVLNADDPEAYKLRNNSQVRAKSRKIVLYSTSSENSAIKEHIAKGEDAFWCDDGWLCAYHNKQSYRFIHVDDVPFTLGGRADFQVSNALAALAAGLNLGATIWEATSALRSFHGSFDNPGRVNLYKLREGYLFLDYGHNTDAISAFGKMLKHWPGYSTTAVLGLPGDRKNEILLDAAAISARIFDQIILRDDEDLRGRRPGEVPEMMKDRILQEKPTLSCVIQHREADAVAFALDQIKSNEIVAIFYDQIDPAMKVIRQYDPMAIHTLPNLNLKTPDGIPKSKSPKRSVYFTAELGSH